jgi:N-acetylgalactosamine 4-sulfate 6-O-sulfotransferase
VFRFCFVCTCIYISKPDKIFNIFFFYFVGFTKAGSSDVFYKTTLHQNIYGSCLNKDGKLSKSCKTKEVHFWDNLFCKVNNTFESFTRGFQLYDGEGKRNKYFSELSMNEIQRKLMFYEGTPRTVWHGDDWKQYESNQGLDVPKVLLPHIIYHVNPQTKFVIVVRNPIARLKSDYKFFFKSKDKNGTDFHQKVVKAVEWWKKCTSLYPVMRCAYGKAPNGLPKLDFEYCLEDRSFCREVKTVCHHKFSWNTDSTAADKLRICLYGLYIN